ncbi:MAG: flippase-like domain-containing protein, partial [Tannerella sp.]|nr:flippase-like domain-containing protein [Tannerella sp.]
MSSKLTQLLKIFIPLALGIVILYFLYAKTDFAELWTNILGTNWYVLTLSLIFGLAGNLIRGLRWDLLIRPLGYRPRRSNLIYAILGNYAVNFALPRAGEIWRCGVVAKEEKIPLTRLIGTLLVDRLFDMIMVALIFLLAISLNVRIFYRNIHGFDFPGWLVSPSFYIGCVAVLASVVLVMFLLRKNFVVRKIILFFASLWKDILQIRRMERKMRFIVYTLGIWVSYFLYFFIAFRAFDYTA